MTKLLAWLPGHQQSVAQVLSIHPTTQTKHIISPFSEPDCGIYCGQSYVCCWSFLVLGHTALQVEREVMAVDQNALAELLLKLLHIGLYSREVQFLREAQWRVLHSSSEGLIS